MMPRVPKGTTYNGSFVTQVWAAAGIATPQVEYQFDTTRKWRFDFAWPKNQQIGDGRSEMGGKAQPQLPSANCHLLAGGVALEVQGGLWVRGRHTRGAGQKNDMEKFTAAAVAGWRILYCQPSEVTSTRMVNNIKAALKI